MTIFGSLTSDPTLETDDRLEADGRLGTTQKSDTKALETSRSGYTFLKYHNLFR